MLEPQPPTFCAAEEGPGVEPSTDGQAPRMAALRYDPSNPPPRPLHIVCTLLNLFYVP